MHRIADAFRKCSRPFRQLSPTLVAVAISVASFLPGSVKHLIRSRGPLHNWYHLMAFAGLSILLSKRTSSLSTRVTYAAWAILLGCSIEVAEAAARYAQLEWADVVCDALGVLLGLIVTWRVEVARRKGTQAPLPRVPTPELA